MADEFAYRQLENWLLQGLSRQRWMAGDRLPSVRQLCREKGVSKATVLHAYERLERLGRVEARPRSGYFVCPDADKGEQSERQRPAQTELAPVPVNVSEVFSDIMLRGAAFDLLPREQQREEVPVGVVQLNRCLGRALRQRKGSVHQHYDEPAGYLPLRQQLALRYSRDGCQLTAEDLCITSGCQHALFLALRVCCRPGDVVAVETPGFYGVLQLLEQLGLKVLEIPASAVNGMDLDCLEQALQQWPIRACVVTPSFATPTGALMPTAQQQRLLALAERHDVTIIEDDIYRELSFYGRRSPLKAGDRQQRVVLCGSFSKTLSRDIRLGWVAGGRWQKAIIHLKMITQLAGSRFVQQGMSEFLSEGGYDRHLRQRSAQLLQQSRDLIQALQRLWPGDAIYHTTPSGGLCLWLELPQPIDTLALYNPALQAGIVITPGPLFSASGQYANALRLSFSQPLTDERLQALEVLRQLLQTQSA